MYTMLQFPFSYFVTNCGSLLSKTLSATEGCGTNVHGDL